MLIKHFLHRPAALHGRSSMSPSSSINLRSHCHMSSSSYHRCCQHQIQFHWFRYKGQYCRATICFRPTSCFLLYSRGLSCPWACQTLTKESVVPTISAAASSAPPHSILASTAAAIAATHALYASRPPPVASICCSGSCRCL